MAAAYFNPPPLGPYQYHEVLSSLRKTIKLGQTEEAMYWANVILRHTEKGGPALVAKQLWIMAAEDLYDPMIELRAFAVFTMASKVGETDHIMFLVADMCLAPKWWESERGREIDRLWTKVEGDRRSAERNHPIPPFALDRHTRRGWSIFKATGKMDDRYSGTIQGRNKTTYLYLRDGLLDPSLKVEEHPDGRPDAGFKAWWREVRQLLHARKSDIEPNDPLGPEDAEEDETETLFADEGPRANDPT
jgi:hypothetical protein